MSTAIDRLDEHEHKVSGVPKHWEKTEERKQLDAELQQALLTDLLGLLPSEKSTTYENAVTTDEIKKHGWDYYDGYNACVGELRVALTRYFGGEV